MHTFVNVAPQETKGNFICYLIKVKKKKVYNYKEIYQNAIKANKLKCNLR